MSTTAEVDVQLQQLVGISNGHKKSLIGTGRHEYQTILVGISHPTSLFEDSPRHPIPYRDDFLSR